MEEQSRHIVNLALVIGLLWGGFWIASLGDVSITSLLLGILITVIGILLIGVPGTAPVASPGHQPGRFGFDTGPHILEKGGRDELDAIRQRMMLDGGVAWEQLSIPREPHGGDGGYRDELSVAEHDGGERLPRVRLRRFEATWGQAMKELDPGPGDVLLSSVSNTRIAKEFLSGFGGPSEGFATIGVTSNMPDDVLILREVVETRAAPDRTLYRRTIQALMRKDGMCEYRALGKEPCRTGFPSKKAVFTSS